MKNYQTHVRCNNQQKPVSNLVFLHHNYYLLASDKKFITFSSKNFEKQFVPINFAGMSLNGRRRRTRTAMPAPKAGVLPLHYVLCIYWEQIKILS